MDRRELLNDTEESLRMAFEGLMANVWKSLPCIVQSVNFDEMTVSVQPAVQAQVESPDGSKKFVNLPVLIHVPILYASGGGFTLTFPIALGDECLVFFADRCIDAWWQNGGIGVQMELRMHDLSDGFAFFGPKSQPNVISGINTANVQLRSDDGLTYVEITPDGNVSVKAPSVATIEAPDIQLKGNVTVTGTVVATVSVAAPTVTAATVAATTGLTIASHDYTTHKHGGVTTGAGQTGVVVP